MEIKISAENGELASIESKSESILDDFLSNDLPVNYSCKTGSCGLCKANLESGKVLIGKNVVDSKCEVLTCQAKPLTNVVLSIDIIPELAELKPKIIPCKFSTQSYVGESVINIKVKIPPKQEFKFLPGQYVDIKYKGLTRSYSIAGFNRSTSEIELHIRIVDGGTFTSMLAKGDISSTEVLRLKGPLGTFFVRKSNSPIIFLAGGTGYAPIKAMINGLLSNDSDREMYPLWQDSCHC